MSRRFALAIMTAGGVAATSSAAAQTYAVKKCDSPREPLGVIHGQGQVAYRLSKAGRPDTGSIRVVSVRGISPGGLRSAAVRELSACLFDRSHDTTATATDVFVVDAIGFDSATVIVTAATVVAETVATIPIPPHTGPAPDPMDATDTTLEERPRRLSCDRVAEMPPLLGTFRTRQDYDAAVAAWQRQNSGVLHARITVDVEGRVSRDGIVVVTSTNPAMMDTFVGALLSCRYAPGRMAGIPVPTIVATRTSIGLPSGPP